LTVAGLADDQVCIADRYRIGEAEFEATSYAAVSPVPTSSWTCED
jgi:MOSC domain-containing protein YiiM